MLSCQANRCSVQVFLFTILPESDCLLQWKYYLSASLLLPPVIESVDPRIQLPLLPEIAATNRSQTLF